MSNREQGIGVEIHGSALLPTIFFAGLALIFIAVVGSSEYQYWSNGVPLKTVLVDAIHIPPFAMQETLIAVALFALAWGYCRGKRIQINQSLLVYRDWFKRIEFPIGQIARINLISRQTAQNSGGYSQWLELGLENGKALLSLSDSSWRRADLRALIVAVERARPSVDISRRVRDHFKIPG
jgi:hypothetical protein